MQGKISDTELHWLAGFIDGEGCFDWQKQCAKGLKADRWRPRFRIANCDVPTLAVVEQIMVDMEAGHHVSWRYPSNPKWSPSWSVEITGMKRLHRWLPKIISALRTKRAQAQIQLDFLNLRAAVNPANPYTQKEMELIKALSGAKGH